MGSRADAGRGVDGQADVTDVRERGAPAMDPNADPDAEIVGPGVDFSAACSRHRSADDVSDVVQHVAIAVAQPMRKAGR